MKAIRAVAINADNNTEWVGSQVKWAGLHESEITCVLVPNIHQDAPAYLASHMTQAEAKADEGHPQCAAAKHPEALVRVLSHASILFLTELALVADDITAGFHVSPLIVFCRVLDEIVSIALGIGWS